MFFLFPNAIFCTSFTHVNGDFMTRFARPLLTTYERLNVQIGDPGVALVT